MNQSVPDFHEIEDDYWIPTTSGTSGLQKPVTKEEGITELVWQNGQIVMQNQRSTKRTGGGGGEVVAPAEREIRFGGEEQQQQHLFMQEDEMASWLQYSLDDSTFNRVLYGDLLYSAPPPPIPITTITQPRVVAEIRPPPAPPRPPVAPTVVKTDNAPRSQNFGHFSRIPARPRAESVNISSVTTAREWTVVESNETPIVRPPPEPRVSHSVAESTPLVVNGESPTATDGGTSATAGELAAGTCDLTVSSSPGGSRASFSASGEPHQSQHSPAVEAAEDRKRKARENDDSEYQSEDVEFEATETKKQARGSTWPKRSRAAEVHNLSERRRRDRINEKMKALQELIPRCNKLDKASMLDEAIEYLKSLQLQVQMMSMGCPMVPMMYPGMQQYMPAMCLGMGMNRPMVPYPSLLPGSPVLNPAAHMGPAGFPMPAPFPIPQVHVPDHPSGSQASNLTEHVPYFPHYQHQPNMPNFVDPYQQFIGVHQGQLSVPQNQAGSQPGVTKPSTSIEGNHDS